MCSCAGVPGSGASDAGVCANAALANASVPENASERARTTFPISASWQTSPGTFAIISRAAKEAVNWTTWAVVGPSRRVGLLDAAARTPQRVRRGKGRGEITS
jgi:hypothetical protein